MYFCSNLSELIKKHHKQALKATQLNLLALKELVWVEWAKDKFFGNLCTKGICLEEADTILLLQKNLWHTRN